eukprot:Amastigsp_a341009_23.p5 type:complete len:151 gc:universal Amastigsp_a341009_23:717-265(-)
MGIASASLGRPLRRRVSPTETLGILSPAPEAGTSRTVSSTSTPMVPMPPITQKSTSFASEPTVCRMMDDVSMPTTPLNWYSEKNTPLSRDVAPSALRSDIVPPALVAANAHRATNTAEPVHSNGAPSPTAAFAGMLSAYEGRRLEKTMPT